MKRLQMVKQVLSAQKKTIHASENLAALEKAIAEAFKTSKYAPKTFKEALTNYASLEAGIVAAINKTNQYLESIVPPRGTSQRVVYTNQVGVPFIDLKGLAMEVLDKTNPIVLVVDRYDRAAMSEGVTLWRGSPTRERAATVSKAYSSEAYADALAFLESQPDIADVMSNGFQSSPVSKLAVKSTKRFFQFLKDYLAISKND